METYEIKTIGGKSKVIYTIAPWWGLGFVMAKKQQALLFNYVIQEYTRQLLLEYAGMSKTAVAITISNRAKTDVSNPLSYWRFLYKMLVTESNYDKNDRKASAGVYSKISESAESFKQLSGLSVDDFEAVAIDFIESTVPSNPDGSTAIPTKEELNTRTIAKMKLDLNSEKETLNPNNNKMVQVPGVGGINQNYLIIGVLAIVGYFIWKKNK